MVAVGEPAEPSLQALVRWDPTGFAGRELDERQSAHLPPASRLATLTGPEDVLTSALSALTLPVGAEVLGPVPVAAPVPAPDRLPTRRTRRCSAPWSGCPVPPARALSRTLVEMQGVRDAKKQPPVRVQVDPVGLE